MVEMNKWMLGAAAFAGGLIIGKNWKKIAEKTTEVYKKGAEKLGLKAGGKVSSKKLSKKELAKEAAA